MRPSRIVGVLASVALVVAACGGNGDATTSDPSSEQTTTVPPENGSSAATTTQQIEAEPLVYVSLGPSSNFYPGPETGMIFLYAESIAEEFGVEVDHRNHTIGADKAQDLLNRIKTNDQLRQDLAEADVVTLMFPIDHWVTAMQTAGGYQGMDPALCGGDDNQQCLRDAFTVHKQHVDAILEELTLQCPPTEVLIRIADTYMIHTRDKISAGTLEFISPFWSDAQEYIEEAASNYGIPVAHVFDALNGPDGLSDPEAKGLMLDDQEHPNEAGARLMADLLDALGYDLAS